jgi:hypothetical protein
LKKEQDVHLFELSELDRSFKTAVSRRQLLTDNSGWPQLQFCSREKDVDGWHKAGHDEQERS